MINKIQVDVKYHVAKNGKKQWSIKLFNPATKETKRVYRSIAHTFDFSQVSGILSSWGVSLSNYEYERVEAGLSSFYIWAD